jgi:MATE family multidrug resistance protein
MTSSHLKLLWVEARQTLLLALPIITSQLGQLLLGFVDTLMVGHLGVVPLAASAFSVSIFSVVLVFGFGVSSCISPLVARADGAQQKRECGEVLRHGLIFMVVFGIALALIIELISSRLNWFGQTEEVVRLSKDYLVVMGWSILPALLYAALRQFSEGLSQATFPMLVMLVGVALNSFLNWLWIFGHGGFSAYGLLGAAWATFVTRSLMCVVLFAYVLRSVKFEEYLPIRWLAALRLQLFEEMTRLGLPSALQTLFEVGAFAGSAVMMGWIGTTALAAHQIAISIASITFMVTLGLSFASSIRVSNALGRGDFVAARRVGFGGISLGAIIMAFFGIIILATAKILPRFYVNDIEVIELAAKLLVIGAFFQIFDGVQGVAIGALRGLHDVIVPTYITAIAYWVVSIPLVYLYGFSWGHGAVGMWVGLSIGLIVAATALTMRFHSITRRKINGQFEQNSKVASPSF